MRITALKMKLAGVIASMEGVLQVAADDGGRDLTAEEQAAFDAHAAETATLEAQIKREEQILALKASAAQPVTVPGATPVATVPAEPAEKGLKFARITRALAAAKGNPMVASQIAEGWGESGLFANQNIGSGAAGGFLVPEAVSGEIIELLRPMSVIMSLQPTMVPLPNGNLTLNRQATGASASYIGEQQNIGATGVTFGQVKLSAKKLAALIPISNDLLRSASIAADRFVRDDLVMSLATRADLAFIRGSGTEFTPRGLRYQLTGYAAIEATNILTANATVNLANVTNDAARLELAIRNGDVTVIRPGWVMSPRTESYLQNLRDGNGNYVFPEMLARGVWRGKPYRVTTQIPDNLGGGSNESELYLADFGHIVVGEHMGIMVEMSSEAAYVDVAGTMQAAFSRDETIMRAIQQHDIGTRHLRAIAVLTAVTWGAA